MHYNFNLFNMSYNDDEELKIGVDEEDENDDLAEDLNEPLIEDDAEELDDDPIMADEVAGLNGSLEY